MLKHPCDAMGARLRGTGAGKLKDSIALLGLPRQPRNASLGIGRPALGFKATRERLIEL
jgi:hypothetical protein